MKTYGSDKKWPFAKGGGSTILVFTLLTVVATISWLVWPYPVNGFLTMLSFLFWCLILYFFRDPNRSGRDEPGLVMGPADGKIVEIFQEHEPRYLQERVTRISIFLSVTDVHVQRLPLTGQVIQVDHRRGKFLQAFRPEASIENEYIAMVLESPCGRILVKQIAGILARRCVNFARPGDELKTGQRFGLIRFGSRVDLFLPLHAQLLVSVGDRVLGGLTPIASLSNGRAAAT
jgi:phosphatidylserine decarboxylase